MTEFILSALILWTPLALDRWWIHHQEKKITRFHVGQPIYRYEDFMNERGKVISVTSNGEGYCRGQLYRKIRLPFQSQYKEIDKENELDSCTGEIFHNGKWTKSFNNGDK